VGLAAPAQKPAKGGTLTPAGSVYSFKGTFKLRRDVLSESARTLNAIARAVNANARTK
jgi:hypothetical protein